MRERLVLAVLLAAVALAVAPLQVGAAAGTAVSPAPVPTPLTSLLPSTPSPPTSTPSGSDCGQSGGAATGVNSLLPRPCIQQGNQPNLSERYPAYTYVWNVDPASLAVGAVESGGVDSNTVWNGLAEGIFQGVVWIGSISAALLEWVFQVDLVGGAGDLVGSVAGALGNHVYRVLVEVMIVLGALWLIWHGLLRRRLTLTLEAMGWMVAALAMAALYLASPTAVVGFLNQESSSIAMGLLGAVGGVDPSLHQNGNQTVYGSGDRSDAALRAAVDRYWTVYVFVPWEVGEFGSVQAGQQLGELELRARTTMQSSDQQAFQDRLSSVELGSSSVKDWYGGNHGTERGVLALVALVTIVAASVLLLAVAAGVVVAQIGMVALAMLAPLFFTVGILPGTGRRIMRRWLELEIGFAVRRVLYAALLGVLLVLSSIVAVAADTRGWLLAGALQLLLILAVWVYRRPFLHIFGSVALPGAVARHASQPQLAGVAHGVFSRSQALVGSGQRRLLGHQQSQVGARPAAGQHDVAERAGGRARRTATTRRGGRVGRVAVAATSAASPQVTLATKGLGAASKALNVATSVLRVGQGLKRAAEPLAEPLMVTGGFSRSRPLPAGAHGSSSQPSAAPSRGARLARGRPVGRQRAVTEEMDRTRRSPSRRPRSASWRRRMEGQARRRRRLWPNPYVESEVVDYPESQHPGWPYPEASSDPAYPETPE